MIEDPRVRLNAALARAAADQLGEAHPVALAAEEGGDGLQAALDGLSDAERDRLLAAAHRLMREDLGAVWSFLPGPAQSDRKH